MPSDAAGDDGGSDHYAGAGDGQCLGLTNAGERCTNGVYGTDHCCGIHKRASDVTFAPEEDDRDWFYCDECGWQPADYERGGGTPPICSECGVEFGGPLRKWGRDEGRAVTDGGQDADGTDRPGVETIGAGGGPNGDPEIPCHGCEAAEQFTAMKRSDAWTLTYLDDGSGRWVAYCSDCHGGDSDAG